MPAPEPLLKLEELSKGYDAVPGAPPLEVLRNINLELARGQSLAVVGPSGCGKSTLLNIIGTLDYPTGGRVWLEGTDLGSLDEIQLARLRSRKIGFVFQSHHLLPHCTALENVLLPTLAAKAASRGLAGHEGQPGEKREEPGGRARRLLERVGLGGRFEHRPGQMSGGERQRVAVVRALINQPALLLADEPTGALDRASAEGLGQLLVELNREEGVTLVTVTHSSELARRMKQTLELREGALRKIDPGQA